MKSVTIWTDGACSGNPGKGGWGAILAYGSVRREMSGCSLETTNNRMELTGAIEALQALKEPCKVLLISDSKYVTDGINKGWVEQSKERGWRKTNKQPFLNSDLWETLLSLMNIHEVTFQWIKGHSSNPENERCDFLATTAYQNI